MSHLRLSESWIRVNISPLPDPFAEARIMANTESPRATPDTPAGERLDSWKEIAAYLKRDVRTVHRWEHTEGLPVHRHPHQKRGSVFAFKAELDRWWDEGRSNVDPPAGRRPGWRSWHPSIVSVLSGLVAITAATLLLRSFAPWHRLRGTDAPPGIRSIAVLPLVNLANDPGEEYFVEGKIGRAHV